MGNAASGPAGSAGGGSGFSFLRPKHDIKAEFHPEIEFDLAANRENLFALRFGPKAGRRDLEFLKKCVLGDPTGSLFAVEYVHRRLWRERAAKLALRAAAAKAFDSLEPAARAQLAHEGYGSLNSSLAHGASALLDARWLCDWAASPQAVLPRRQDLPPEAFYIGPVMVYEKKKHYLLFVDRSL